MDRRVFLQLGAWSAASASDLAGFTGTARAAEEAAATATAGAGTAADLAAYPVSQGWRVYEISTTVTLPVAEAPARVWLPVTAPRIGDYQRTLSTEWRADGAQASLARAPGYDVQMLAVGWPSGAGGASPLASGTDTPAGEAQAPVLTARLVNVVALRDHMVDMSEPPSARGPRESPATLREYLRPTTLLPTDGIVRARALQITAGLDDDVTRARALYEWVVDNTCREASVRGCGVGDVEKMLKTGGVMNGKCADINGLFVALARSIGIPARDAYGVRVDASKYGFKALGKKGDVTSGQHCRAEFYASGYGWVPVDPADVRKVALEEVPGGLPMTDGKVHAARAMLFGKWEMNWVAYNHGHDVGLPGSEKPPIPFLMYPNGETYAGVIDSLDPKRFSYCIASQRLA
jgi:transglutaminase-like putative cysteine protease